MIHRAVPLTFSVVVAALLATGCSPLGVAVGAGATAGVAASEERGIGGTARDTAIRLEISKLWLDKGLDFYKSLEMQIYEGRVLLTGRVPTQDMADTAVRLAWQPKGVRNVINEITIGDSELIDLAADSVTAARLRAELTFTRDVQAINYSVRVVDGIVYLLGVAQDQAELDRVIRTVRAMSGVRGLVSQVLLKNDARRTGAGGVS